MIGKPTIQTEHLKFGGYIVLLLSSLLYGGTVVAARVISGDIPPVALSMLRGLFGLWDRAFLFWPLGYHYARIYRSATLLKLKSQ